MTQTALRMLQTVFQQRLGASPSLLILNNIADLKEIVLLPSEVQEDKDVGFSTVAPEASLVALLFEKEDLHQPSLTAVSMEEGTTKHKLNSLEAEIADLPTLSSTVLTIPGQSSLEFEFQPLSVLIHL
ncbi:hypothetical protein O6H91_04G054000 [Diphasiastrum complanatum]|uniref:Uncharacterized protein n=1 Tax=Diphasiastrum complanatum TaxID=34168 RepID=A0ACC2DWS7_DIPCM|nr:hypothetical protein O6H91_04G054000 [Diphasiastrum complanatum]